MIIASWKKKGRGFRGKVKRIEDRGKGRKENSHERKRRGGRVEKLHY